MPTGKTVLYTAAIALAVVLVREHVQKNGLPSKPRVGA